MSTLNQVDLNDFYTVLQERHSVRVYDPSVKISKEELKEIVELSLSAPSSSNLQPWRFLIIDEPEMKQKLLPIANNQQQVVDSAAVIAVLGDLQSYERAEEIYAEAVKLGAMTEEIKTNFVERLHKGYGGMGPERLHQINLLDAGLVSMQLMLIAKAKGYDTVPMGGYNAEKFVEAFEVPETLKPILLIAIGKAAKAAHPTPRLSVDQVVNWNSFQK
ncbi:putative NAD(P)H nitroreductase YodC [compost metagenome]|uniref:nitroreductase family protein n=1 Tax=Paenibacillus rhizolycopersici TaxID=2780073 RepID=UPI000F92A876|nr:nitroreductase family protein [Paenibacillus timonensis]MUG85150.1 nitroreductase family protein [Paenibacillus timonensis]